MKRSLKGLVIVLINASMCSTMMLSFIVIVVAPDVLVRDSPTNATDINSTFDLQDEASNQSLTEITYQNSENKVKLGIYFGIKGLLQTIISPFAGILIDKTFPLLIIIIAAVADVIAVIIYSFTQSFETFLIARCLNAIGTTCAACGSFSAIPYYFKKEEHRKMINGAIHVVTFLAISASPFIGGALNQFIGQVAAFSAPLLPLYVFIILASLPFLIDYWKIERKSKQSDTNKNLEKQLKSKHRNEEFSNPIADQNEEPSVGFLKDNEYEDKNSNRNNSKSVLQFSKLLKDPYILISIFAVGIPNWGNLGISVTLPLYMRTKFHSQQYQQGLVFLSGIGFHLFGTLVSLFVYRRWSRYSYIFIMATLIINAIATFLLLYIDEWYLLTIPVGVNFFTIAMMEYPLFPFIATLVDKRHASNYGSAYGIAVAFHSLGSGVISFISGPFVTEFGFSYFILGISCMYLVYVPFLLFTSDYWR